MSVTKKAAIWVVLTVFALLMMNWLVLNQQLVSTFHTYEDGDVERNTSRVKESIESVYRKVGQRDWSEWTDIYDFLNGQNESFERKNLDLYTLENIGIDVMVIADTNNQIVWSGTVLQKEGEAIEFSPSLLPPHLTAATSEPVTSLFTEYRGILATEVGPMLISARPILRGDGSGPTVGTLTMGKVVDQQWVTSARKSTKVALDIHPINALGPSLQGIVDQIASGKTSVVTIKSDNVVSTYEMLRDLAGEPALLVETKSSRKIWNHGKRLRLLAVALFLVSGLVIMAVMAVCMRIMVSQPLLRLTKHIQEIEKTGAIPRMEQVDDEGEIGQLARRFASLLKSQQEAEKKSRLLMTIIDHTAISMAFTDAKCRVQYANSTLSEVLAKRGLNEAKMTLREIFAAQGQSKSDFDEMWASVKAGNQWSVQFSSAREDGVMIDEVMHVSPVSISEKSLTHLLISYQDVSEKNAMQKQLEESRRLESVGQLAAGIAHEINTPVQFVYDNTQFIKESFADISGLLQKLQAEVANDETQVDAATVRSMLEDVDAEFLMEEAPQAIDQTIDGISRISKIVRAMKEFSHPSNDMAMVDLNQAIESTITVASNEWKFVAEMQLDLAQDMPKMYCDVGQLNQVVLNIIVNAAHALADAGKGKDGTLGTISIQTSSDEGGVEIRIADNGTGMPDEVKDKIFDPFYTTKEVGKGTGQGLSIAYDVVVNKHGGTINVDSTPGEGTTFVIQLPRVEAEEGNELIARSA